MISLITTVNAIAKVTIPQEKQPTNWYHRIIVHSTMYHCKSWTVGKNYELRQFWVSRMAKNIFCIYACIPLKNFTWVDFSCVINAFQNQSFSLFRPIIWVYCQWNEFHCVINICANFNNFRRTKEIFEFYLFQQSWTVTEHERRRKRVNNVDFFWTV